MGGVVFVLWADRSGRPHRALSAAHKLKAPDRLRAFGEDRIAREIPSGGKPQGSRTFRGEETLHDSLESLSDEEVAQLTKRGRQAAILLGFLAGVFFVLLGVFGLLFAAQAMPVRLTIDIAVASGICILAGLVILQRTFRKENNAWLLPLKLFTLRVLRLHSAENHKTRRSDHAR